VAGKKARRWFRGSYSRASRKAHMSIRSSEMNPYEQPLASKHSRSRQGLARVGSWSMGVGLKLLSIALIYLMRIYV